MGCREGRGKEGWIDGREDGWLQEGGELQDYTVPNPERVSKHTSLSLFVSCDPLRDALRAVERGTHRGEGKAEMVSAQG